MINLVNKRDLAKKKELLDTINKRRQEQIDKHNADMNKINLYKEKNIIFNIKKNMKVLFL